MRFYELYIDNQLFASNSSKNPTGIHIEYDFIMYETRNTPLTQFKLYNSSYNLLGSTNNFRGKKIELRVGMDGFLPTVDKKQQGTIFTGQIVNTYTAPSTIESITILLCDVFDPYFQISAPLDIQKGQLVSDALIPILRQLQVTYQFSVEMQKIKAKVSNGVKISNLRSILTFIDQNYGIVTQTTANGLLFRTRDEPAQATYRIKNSDFLAQPAINGLEIVFPMQARGDISISDKIIVENANDISLVNFAYNQYGNVGVNGVGDIAKYVTGTYIVTQIKQLGASRNSDALAWQTLATGVRAGD